MTLRDKSPFMSVTDDQGREVIEIVDGPEQ
jgi:hypothetical protein